MLEEISNITAPTIKNKIYNINLDKKRTQSPNLMISNLSDNKQEDYQDEGELGEMLPKFEERKHIDIDKDEIISYTNNLRNKKPLNNLDHNYDYENENFNENSNIYDKNSLSEIDNRDQNSKNKEYNGKVHF